jgi:TIGR03009 family protein
MSHDLIGKVIVLAVVVSAWHSPQPEARAQAQVQRPPAKAQAPAAPAPDPAKNAARLKQILKDWEVQSQSLKTLVVHIERTDTKAGWDEKDQFKGYAMLKSPNYAFLDFQHVDIDPAKPDKPVFTDYERIICTGNEVWQYDSPAKQIFIYTLDKTTKKGVMDQGPLPFLFNMKAAEAEARYEMALIRETKTHCYIGVKPRLQVDQAAFSQASLSLNKANYYLPDRIIQLMPNGKDMKDFVLKEVEPNKPVAEANFKGVRVKGWSVRVNPQNDIAAPAPAAPPGRPNTVGRQQPAPSTAPRR